MQCNGPSDSGSGLLLFVVTRVEDIRIEQREGKPKPPLLISQDSQPGDAREQSFQKHLRPRLLLGTYTHHAVETHQCNCKIWGSSKCASQSSIMSQPFRLSSSACWFDVRAFQDVKPEYGRRLPISTTSAYNNLCLVRCAGGGADIAGGTSWNLQRRESLRHPLHCTRCKYSPQCSP